MWSITFADTGGLPASTLAQIEAVFDEATAYWGRYIDFNGATLEVEVQILDLGFGTLAQAGPEFFFDRFEGGQSIFEAGPIIELTTGVDPDPNVADIFVDIDRATILSGEYFFGSLADGNEVPNRTFDLLSVILHELTHGLGFLSILDEPGTNAVTFDLFVEPRGSGLGFVGPASSSILPGGFIPLRDNDPSHTDGIVNLMNAFIRDGERLILSEIDVAVLSDLGLPILGPTNGNDILYGFERTFASLTYPGGNDTISLLGGDDQYFGLSGDDSVHGDGGADLIDGGTGTNILNGGAGNDTLVGEGSNQASVFSGNEGNDFLVGPVNLYGGEGDDTLSLGSDGEAVSGATLRGEGGIDSLTFADFSVPVAINASDAVIDNGDGPTLDPMSVDWAGGFVSIDGFETLEGTAFGDTLIGGDGSNYIMGGGGNDLLIGEA